MGKARGRSQARSDRKAPDEGGATAAFDRVTRALEWPGLVGWLGTVFGVAGLWFVASAIALSSKAGKITDASPEARSAAESSRRLGFGGRFIRPVLGEPREGAAKRPFRGRDIVRARLAVEANARASGVFGGFALLVAAFWWGFRLLDPLTRTGRAEARPVTSGPRRRGPDAREGAAE